VSARIVRAAAIALAVVAAAIQATSYALFGATAARPSLPALFTASWPFGIFAATGIARSPLVRRELARAALLRGDDPRAAALLAGADSGDAATDLRGRLAADTGDIAAAMRDYGQVGDVVRARLVIDRVAATDPRTALRLAEAFDRATIGRDVPEAVIAQADWREGELAAQVAASDPDDARYLTRKALARYLTAARLDPTQDAYGLAAGFEAIVAGDDLLARDAYGRVVANDPQSVDAAAGLAVAQALDGACGPAAAAFARAKQLAAQQHRVLDVARAGYSERAQRSLLRCLPISP
jgi:hypothetical protein